MTVVRVLGVVLVVLVVWTFLGAIVWLVVRQLLTIDRGTGPGGVATLDGWLTHSAGVRVVHDRHGLGTVTRHAGRDAWVVFDTDGDFTRAVPGTALSPVTGDDEQLLAAVHARAGAAYLDHTTLRVPCCVAHAPVFCRRELCCGGCPTTPV